MKFPLRKIATKNFVVPFERDHRRTGLEIFGRGGGADTNLPDSCRRRARTSRAVRGNAPQENFEKRVFLMPFPAFWCGFLCMEQVTNEKKILRTLVKQHEKEDCPTLK